MYVDLYVVAVGVFDTANNVVGRLWFQQSCHVFEGDGVCPHIEELSGQFNVAINIVQGGYGVADGALGMATDFLHRGHGTF